MSPLLKKNSPRYVLRLKQIPVKKLLFLRTFRSWKKLKDLQKDLKDLNGLCDYQNKERNYLWRKYAQAHKD